LVPQLFWLMAAIRYANPEFPVRSPGKQTNPNENGESAKVVVSMFVV